MRFDKPCSIAVTNMNGDVIISYTGCTYVANEVHTAGISFLHEGKKKAIICSSGCIEIIED